MMRSILFLASLPMIAAPFISMGASPATATPLHASVLIADSYHNNDNYQYRNSDNRNRNPDYYRSWYNNHHQQYKDRYSYDWYRKNYHKDYNSYYQWYYNRYNH